MSGNFCIDHIKRFSELQNYDSYYIDAGYNSITCKVDKDMMPSNSFLNVLASNIKLKYNIEI